MAPPNRKQVRKCRKIEKVSVSIPSPPASPQMDEGLMDQNKLLIYFTCLSSTLEHLTLLCGSFWHLMLGISLNRDKKSPIILELKLGKLTVYNEET